MLAPDIATAHLRLCLPGPERAPGLLRYHIENQDHFRRWEPPRPAGFLSVHFWEAYTTQVARAFELDQALRLVAVDRATDEIVGMVNYTQLVRGPFQACYLGYGIDHRFEGRGLMTEALLAGNDFVFRRLGLHRIMANYMPINERSGRLLRRLGFVVEGYARDYLFIDGAWRDHVLTALTSPEAGPPASGPLFDLGPPAPGASKP